MRGPYGIVGVIVTIVVILVLLLWFSNIGVGSGGTGHSLVLSAFLVWSYKVWPLSEGALLSA